MIKRVGSGGPWEEVVGYSRAVAAGDTVYVSGCTSVRDGAVVEGDAYAQAVVALQVVREALARFGVGVEAVVRTRIYLTDVNDWEAVGRAHGEVFGAVRPAATMVAVAALIDPRLCVEIEAVAQAPGVGG